MQSPMATDSEQNPLGCGRLLDRLASDHYQIAIVAAANGANIPSRAVRRGLLGFYAHDNQVLALEGVLAFFEVKSRGPIADIGPQSLVDRIHAKHRKLAQVSKAIGRRVINPVLGLSVGGSLFGHK